ncbi:hypothetical protein PRIPAC_89331 [Pristionchus pacificus]|uniref:NADAR domain-containing protein n=1 Tax=Pristionchus pacificus TaxID=54126 RepID=A0A2A6B921_PRIPA|nr:hypothetical protein PRIPAC_89331 [Pristionchus pacificus]|eukprot:PDM62379.1 hypothetical protein PRIPAC_51821 [Pristionchus pacificus]
MSFHTFDQNGKPLVLFFTVRSELSNFFPCIFHDPNSGLRFNCNEQLNVMAVVMACDSPRDQKEIGKRVVGFRQQKWDTVSRDVMKKGLLLKFGSNKRLKDILVGTNEAILAEPSPFDRRWGIGLDAADPKARDTREWKGENRLGAVLMEVRSMLREVRHQ